MIYMIDAGITLKNARSNLPRHAAPHTLSVGEGEQLLSAVMPKAASQSEALKRAWKEEKPPIERKITRPQKNTTEVLFWQA